MAKKKTSSLFWVKHLFLAVALILVALVVINLQKIQIGTPQPEGSSKKSPAAGLSSFYQSYRNSTNPEDDLPNDFVMDIATSDEPLGDRLVKMESIQKPVSEHWKGEHKFRTFRAGGTLRETITQYAQSEGMQVIWELEQDFVVKSNFQVEDTVIGTLREIAKAIDSNFNGRVEAYFCPRQRSLVITAKPVDYLKLHCQSARKSS